MPHFCFVSSNTTVLLIKFFPPHSFFTFTGIAKAHTSLLFYSCCLPRVVICCLGSVQSAYMPKHKRKEVRKKGRDSCGLARCATVDQLRPWHTEFKQWVGVHQSTPTNSINTVMLEATSALVKTRDMK